MQDTVGTNEFFDDDVDSALKIDVIDVPFVDVDIDFNANIDVDINVVNVDVASKHFSTPTEPS